MIDKTQLKELNKLIAVRGNERYILSKLKTMRYLPIGKQNLKNLIDCLRWKDVHHNVDEKIPMTEVSMEWFTGRPYETYIEYFNRWLKKEKLAEIKRRAASCKVILPNECHVESVGQIKDTNSIIRLKKEASEVAKDLMELGVGADYSFVNMKLYVSYYHHIHAPVSGRIKRMLPIEGKSNFFGKNTLWFLEFETKKKPVYQLLVGESAIQDFNFLVKKNDYVKIGDDMGYFAWGSQTVLLFDKGAYQGDILIAPQHHYFLGQPVIKK